MIEFFLGFIIGSGWMLIVPLLLLALIIEHNECHGWTFIIGLIALGCAMIAFNLTWTHVGYGAIAYLPVGILWSCWRWKRRCSLAMREYDALVAPTDEHDNVSVRCYKVARQTLRERITFNLHVDTIVLWAVAWPFSAIQSLVGDVLDTIESTIRKIARGTYRRWSDQATNHFDSLDAQRDPDFLKDRTPSEYR